jgi:hypothetical protein
MSTETTDQTANDQDARMGRAVIRGIQIALPSAFIFLTLGIWMITDLSLGQSFVTAALPSVLLGGFAGGFAGVAATM